MNFFKTFLASLLAIIVAFGLMIMLSSLILVGLVASLGASAPSVPNNSVLRLNLGTITDEPATSVLDEFDFMTMTATSRTTLLSAVSAIKAAADDGRIKGIYINFDERAHVSLSSLEEIRAALAEFKESGKFIVAYNEVYGQAAYYVSSVADRIYVNPEGGMDWTGLSFQTMFYKGLLDKLDIEPVIIRHGSFKSAVEPYMYDRMSPENRLQNQTLANSVWALIVEAVSEARGIPVDRLQQLANTLAIDSPSAALASGLVDGIRYEDEVMSELNAMIRHWSRGGTVDESSETVVSEDGEVWISAETVVEETPAENVETDTEDAGSPAAETKRGAEKIPNIVSFGDYAAQAAAPGNSLSKNKIAVIYAEGAIVSGDGKTGRIGSAAMLEKLSRVRRDPNVKAVVFRVNSPGGSALASEVMWRELQLLKQEVPVIVSMGDYAASGGYYISCPADVIYANRSTITGSIGVFGLFANLGNTFRNKLGLTVDGVNTNTYSDIGSMFRPVMPAERAFFQKSVDNVYATFVGHVAAGRNMTFEAVDKIAEGRVWSGADAVGIGLVDGIGGIVDALAIAADRAGITDDFRIWEVVDAPTGLAAILGGFSASLRRSVMADEMGEMFIHYNNLKSILEEEGVQARIPYLIEFE